MASATAVAPIGIRWPTIGTKRSARVEARRSAAQRAMAVALPAIGLVFGSHIPFPLVPCNSPPRMLVSRTRPAAEAVAVAAAMGAQLVGMGSAGAKAMAVLRGEAEIYLHTGGQYEWDSCAPSAVAQAAGLHVSRIDGSPLIYNQADAYLTDLLICRPEHAAEVISRAAGAVAR